MQAAADTAPTSAPGRLDGVSRCVSQSVSQNGQAGVVALIARLPLPLWRLLPQISGYTLVSALALGVDTLVLLSLTNGCGFSAMLAGSISYLVGMLLHFVLSAGWVFRSAARGRSRLRQFAGFASTGAVGLAITCGLLLLGSDVAGLPTIVAKGVAVGFSFVAVFLLRRTFVFGATTTAAG